MRVNIKGSEKKKVKDLTNNNPWLAAMMGASYSQIDKFIDKNVTDFSKVVKLLKLIVKILVFLIRRQI